MDFAIKRLKYYLLCRVEVKDRRTQYRESKLLICHHHPVNQAIFKCKQIIQLWECKYIKLKMLYPTGSTFVKCLPYWTFKLNGTKPRAMEMPVVDKLHNVSACRWPIKMRNKFTWILKHRVEGELNTHWQL